MIARFEIERDQFIFPMDSRHVMWDQKAGWWSGRKAAEEGGGGGGNEIACWIPKAILQQELTYKRISVAHSRYCSRVSRDHIVTVVINRSAELDSVGSGLVSRRRHT